MTNEIDRHLNSAAGMLQEACEALRIAFAKAETRGVKNWLMSRAMELDGQIASITRDIEDEDVIQESIEDARLDES